MLQLQQTEEQKQACQNEQAVAQKQSAVYEPHRAKQRPVKAKHVPVKSKHQPIQAKHQPVAKNAQQGNLPEPVKGYMEKKGGVNLEDVNVHYNSGEPAKVGALAYAKGSDIHLGQGQERHLEHEVWHVVQQKQGRVKTTSVQAKGLAINDDPQLEREADIMGKKVKQVAFVSAISQNTKKTSNTSGTGIVQKKGPEDDKDFENLLILAGSDVEKWRAGFQSYTFLGLQIANSVHQELATCLDNAQNYLRTRFQGSGLNDQEIREAIGLYRLVGSRPPTKAVNSQGISYHSFGLAIDVNVKGNPYLGRGVKLSKGKNASKEEKKRVKEQNKANSRDVANVIADIYFFMTGEYFDIHALPKKGEEEAHRAKLQEVSQAFAEYFKMRDDPEGIKTLLERKKLQQFEQEKALNQQKYTEQYFEYLEGSHLQHHPPEFTSVPVPEAVTDEEIQAILNQIDDHSRNPDLRHDMQYGKQPKMTPKLATYLAMENNPEAVRAYLEQKKREQTAAQQMAYMQDQFEYLSGSMQQTHLPEFMLPEGFNTVTKAEVQAELKIIEATATQGVRDYTQGFIDLSEPVVTALVQQGGLVWGAGHKNISKDIMHFAYQDGTINDKLRSEYKKIKASKENK